MIITVKPHYLISKSQMPTPKLFVPKFVGAHYHFENIRPHQLVFIISAYCRGKNRPKSPLMISHLHHFDSSKNAVQRFKFL